MHLEFQPPSSLHDTIKCFWYDKREFSRNGSSFDIIPDGYAEIVFHFGNPCIISYNNVTQPLPSPSILGLVNKPVTVNTKDILHVIGIRCYPWTVFDLLGISPGTNSMQTLKHPISRLQSTLQEFIDDNKIDEAINCVQQYALGLRTEISVDTMLFKAGTAMLKANGALPVSEVASSAHTTVRTLERKFKRSSGHTVKDVSHLIRFEQVRNHLWRNPRANLAALADEFGYTDQSHLSREFKKFSGTTPAAFAHKGKVEGNQFVAFVLA